MLSFVQAVFRINCDELNDSNETPLSNAIKSLGDNEDYTKNKLINDYLNNPNATANNIGVSLMAAVNKKNPSPNLVRALCEKAGAERARLGISTCRTCKNDDTVLHIAARVGNKKIVEILLEFHADPNIFNKLKESPLGAMIAEAQYDHTLINRLLECANDNNIGASILIAAQRNSDSALVRLLCEKAGRERIAGILSKWVIKNTKDTPLHFATRKSNIETVKILVEFGANPDVINEDDETPLSIAIAQGEQDIFKVLLNVNSPVSDNIGASILATIQRKSPNVKLVRHLCEKAGKELIKKVLAEWTIKIGKRKDTALHLAVLKGNAEIVKVLLEFGANPHLSNAEVSGNTPLSLAIKNDQEKIIEILLADSAPVPANIGTSIFAAIRKEKPDSELVRKLCCKASSHIIKKALNTWVTPQEGDTVLHLAARKGNNEIVNILCEFGANANECNQQNETPYSLLQQAKQNNSQDEKIFDPKKINRPFFALADYRLNSPVFALSSKKNFLLDSVDSKYPQFGLDYQDGIDKSPSLSKSGNRE